MDQRDIDEAKDFALFVFAMQTWHALPAEPEFEPDEQLKTKAWRGALSSKRRPTGEMAFSERLVALNPSFFADIRARLGS
ncbi:hypothetical protein NKI25_01950 [Mesorhizobium sp. M0808]|uniref:hypothetical protein n=1 Tax=Mesorhizobium sp. M0808 TaxID=2957002 RepID=UPI00333C3AC8